MSWIAIAVAVAAPHGSFFVAESVRAIAVNVNTHHRAAPLLQPALLIRIPNRERKGSESNAILFEFEGGGP